MIRQNDLQKLLALRKMRSQRAERALAQQHAQCELEGAKVAAATARVVAHRDWQQERERALLDGLVGRAVSINDIERVRIAFTMLEEQGETLEQRERQAEKELRAALERKHALAIDRNRRRREQEKMSGLASHLGNAVRRRAELYAEIDQEDCGASRGRSQGAENSRA